MKIQLASDLHLEFLRRNWRSERIIVPAVAADVLVLAGDIANGADTIELFAAWPSPEGPCPVVYVAGNHEFYGNDLGSTLTQMKEAAARHSHFHFHFHFLENDSIEIGNTRFLGATLWTDYRLRSDMSQAQQMQVAQRSLNDHHLIRHGAGLFTTTDALKLHQESRAWLVAELARPWDGKTVVITHHGPHPLSTHARFANDPLTAAFLSDLSEILYGANAPDLWLHGHVHDSFDYTVGSTRVVANPAGYVLNRNWAQSRNELKLENTNFDPALLLEL